jgi:C-terminal processing protease CtpA/Prc
MSRHGEYFVAGIATQDGKPTVQGVRVGDKLLQIGALDTHGASREAMFFAMRGKPGEIRSLILERDNRRIRLPVNVTAF